MNFIEKFFFFNNNRSLATFRHILFWLFFSIGTGVYYTTARIEWVYSISLDILSVIAVYVNFLVLMPNFFYKKELIKYIALLFLLLFFISCLRTILLYSISDFVGFSPIPSGKVHLIFLSDFSCLGPIVLVTMLIKTTRNWYWDQVRLKELEKNNLNAELSFLKSQINPHFLFNILNSIYVLHQTNSATAGHIILKLSDMLRYQLYDCTSDTTVLSAEIEYIKNYLEIQQMRMNHKLELNFVQAGDPTGIVIAPFVFLPFIENAFKHGAEKSVDNAKIKIEFKIEKGEIFLSVINSKPLLKKISTLPTKMTGGIGLQNVIRRLDLIFPNRYELQILDKDLEYCVFLHLKVR